MCVSIELVDSRWAEGLDAPPLAKLADLQSHGALVLGDWVPFATRDWAAQLCRVTIGDRPTVELRGSHAHGRPGLRAARLAAPCHAQRRSAAAGTVVTTGTWCGLLHAAAGDLVIAEFPGSGEL